CEELLNKGCRVIGLGHSKKNCRSAREKLLAVNPAYDITYLWGDLMQLTEVVRLVWRLKSELLRNNEGKLDAVINNAGCVRSWYMTTGEGYEQQFALNHLAGFLLTHELFVNLIKGGGRILFTSSNSHKMMKMNWKDLMFEKRYRPLFVYKQSKLCNMLTALEINARYAGQDIRAYGVDPGLVRTQIGCKNTGKLVDFVWKRRSRHGVDPSVPAKVYAGIICAESKQEGLYYGIDGLKRHSGEVNKQNAKKLFEISESLCGIRFGVTENCMS
ncbi:MAG: SDR family NAD(P)-dependent oxidoreductase, partial [Clostridiales bacterium]|nr:SDR family NAD(P)-dependent oxidoreductase [Clostridiales bacterium]